MITLFGADQIAAAGVETKMSDRVKNTQPEQQELWIDKPTGASTDRSGQASEPTFRPGMLHGKDSLQENDTDGQWTIGDWISDFTEERVYE